MSDKLAFSVPGLPRGKGRPRAVARLRWVAGQPEAFVDIVTPKDTRDAESAVRAAFRRRYPDHRPWTGAVMLRFTAVFPIPASWPKRLKELARRGEMYHTAKPDKDNVEKMIVDALNHVAWTDDAQVQGGGVKRYGEPARIDVVITHHPATEREATPSERRRVKQERQPELTLPAGKPVRRNATNTESRKVDPDLSAWSPRQRAMIERAMRRDEEARRRR